LRQVFHKRSYLLTSSAVRTAILAGALSLDEEAGIIHIIKYKNPLPLLIIAQPVVHELEYIGLWIQSSIDLDAVCLLTRINNEAKVRRSTRSIVLGKAKVMSFRTSRWHEQRVLQRRSSRARGNVVGGVRVLH
jgi:hypothetical protein